MVTVNITRKQVALVLIAMTLAGTAGVYLGRALTVSVPNTDTTNLSNCYHFYADQKSIPPPFNQLIGNGTYIVYVCEAPRR